VTDRTERHGHRRGGGREARRAARAAAAEMERAPFLTRSLAPYEVMGEEGLSLIEENADTILERVGVEIVDYPEALDVFRAGGADVDGTRVRFPRGLCRSLITENAPSSFTQMARNPARSVTIGGPHVVFAPVYGPPFVRDLEGGRRYATYEDFENLVKLTYLSSNLHHSGGTVCEPVDTPVEERHLDMVYAHMRLSDKPFMGSVTHPSRARDTVEMARILFGADTVDSNAVLMSLINANSPLSWDFSMLASAQTYVEAGQAVILTPFILAGAMSPVTPAATATQTLAEAMAGMAFCQMVRPGAPVVLGSFASSMSMQSGAPTFGTPEPALVLFTVAALARRLGVPFRSGGTLTSSKVPDAQAAYEAALTLYPTLLGGVNFVLHSAGWLEGGLVAGYEKFVLDDDQLGAAQALLSGVDLSDNGLALDAIEATGPGRHFLDSPHTLANFTSAFWVSELANNASYEQWRDEGREDAITRANRVWKERLARYEPPAIDDAIAEELQAFMTRRRAEIAAERDSA
jgi:trimethylamine--corrinoid protein Co-methyltransferase